MHLEPYHQVYGATYMVFINKMVQFFLKVCFLEHSFL